MLIIGKEEDYTKRLNTRKLLPHLCKSCAEWMSQAEIADRVTKLNQERREKLGAKGRSI